MEILDHNETGNSNADVEYAGFWIRVGAYFIDGILLGVLQVVVAMMFGGINQMGGGNGFVTLISIVAGVAYFAGMESSSKQATIGKMACGIKVINMEGERISMGNATGRYFAKILSSLILLIGFIMIGFDKKKQGLHDKIANTLVVYK